MSQIWHGSLGFYQPGYKGGANLNSHMMCFGRDWDPQRNYDQYYRSDGFQAPPVPDQLISLVGSSIRDSQARDDEIPSILAHLYSQFLYYKWSTWSSSGDVLVFGGKSRHFITG